jgi:hypothetical protein
VRNLLGPVSFWPLLLHQPFTVTVARVETRSQAPWTCSRRRTGARTYGSLPNCWCGPIATHFTTHRATASRPLTNRNLCDRS